MTTHSSGDTSGRTYQERLIPGPGMFIALLLVIPAVTLVLTAIDGTIALPVGIAIYVIAATTLLLLSPVVRIENGTLYAGHASIPTEQLGRIQLLGAETLRAAIGPGLDARSFMLVRGWIHRGVRIENIDPQDPAPQWIITTRHPAKLSAAITASREATPGTAPAAPTAAD